MPKETFGDRYKFLPKSEVLDFEEIARLAKIFVALGVTKLRLTGGEPLLRPHIENLISLLSPIKESAEIAVTTNGHFLEAKAKQLRDAGLDRLTVSLDALDPAISGDMNGRGFGPQRVLKGITKANEVGFTPIKINTVVKRGDNDNQIIKIAEYFRGTGHIPRFIEYMDVGNLNGWTSDEVVSGKEIVDTIHRRYPIYPINKNYKGEVASRYLYEDGGGEIGIVASVTQPFCGDCTRARISTEGKLYTCLFASTGIDLKTPLRLGVTDEELMSIVTDIWTLREDRYSDLRMSMRARNKQTNLSKVEMFQIGG